MKNGDQAKWQRNSLGFMAPETRGIYQKVDLDGFSLASVQSSISIYNYYERRHGPRDGGVGLLGKPIGKRPFMTPIELAEICGVEKTTEEHRCRLCEKLPEASRKPLIIRYWSHITTRGEIVCQCGNFVRFVNQKSGQKKIDCFCGIPEADDIGTDDDQRTVTHLFQARTARVTSPRPCYSWQAICELVRVEKEEALKAAARALKDAQERKDAREMAELHREKTGGEREAEMATQQRLIREELDNLIGVEDLVGAL